MKNIDELELLRFIKDYYKQHGIVPSTMFLSYKFRVVVQTIYNKLNNLQELGYIQRNRKNERFVGYKILKKGQRKR